MVRVQQISSMFQWKYVSRNISSYKLKRFILKHWIAFTILCTSILLLAVHLYPIWKFSKDNPTLLSMNDDDYDNDDDDDDEDNKPSKPLVYNCCTPVTSNNSIRTNVFFLKTHKTGGTTVQNVIMRFAIMNSLDIMIINYPTYYWPFSNLSIYSKIMTPDNKYNIMASHMRYDSKLKFHQHPDTSMVTILRHPATLFQSLYTFFRMELSTGMTLEQFLKAPKKPSILWGVHSERAYRGYNQMTVDLGFDIRQRENETAVAEFLTKIDLEFDFVMITEYMEESMVLFANLMRWPLEYVAFLKINARIIQQDSYTLTDDDKLILMGLNEIDTLLYDHFLKKFRTCMRQYGEDRLKTQVQQLKILNEQLKQRCVAEEVKRLNTGFVERIEYVAKNESDLECSYSIEVSRVLEPMVINAQAKRLQRLRDP